MSDDNLFWLQSYLGWRVIGGKLYLPLFQLPWSALWFLYFTMFYELCNPKVDVVLPDWRSESQGAIYSYEWCSYYELRASRAGNEGRNRQNRLHLESRTPSWARLWTLSYVPSVYGDDIQTGKSDPPDWKSSRACIYTLCRLKKDPNYLCNWIESYILLCLLGYDHRPIDNCPLVTT